MLINLFSTGAIAAQLQLLELVPRKGGESHLIVFFFFNFLKVDNINIFRFLRLINSFTRDE